MVDANRVPSPDELAASPTGEEGEGGFVGGEPQLMLSGQMAKVCTYCCSKQQEIGQGHRDKVERIRDAYVDRLRAAAETAREKGRDVLAGQLRDAAVAAGNVEAWVERLTD